jgi:mannose-6-phosphate isomerase-like protein (cupin superfamily)
MPPTKISLAEKFSRFSERFQPKVVAELNGQHVKLAKVLGEFVWHHHEHEDEMFLVHQGRLRIEFRDGNVELGPGEMIAVPRGVEHRPVAEEEVLLVLFEPAGTLNTGNTRGDKTVDAPEWI